MRARIRVRSRAKAEISISRTVIIADGQAYKVKETMEEVAALIAAIPEEQS